MALRGNNADRTGGMFATARLALLKENQMKRLTTMTALIALTTAAHAAPETYVIDHSNTSSQFSFNYLGVASQTSRFEKTSGRIVLDPIAKTGSAEVAIDAASINTGHTTLNEHLQAADFFDTARYPTITFKSSKLTLDGDQMSLVGDLTIKGVTRPVNLTVTQFQCQFYPALKAETCSANATVTVKRSDFNMGKYALLASNKVTLNLAIQAVKEQAVIQLANRDPFK